ncbi:uncharacterized protein LOC128548450 [Mercenaria mercenaria]|uniref:uncharacterized protein LOC128548450 n=1 Tax=Mercenaria mercenaria TaxID=6596 RepID=UPI00234EA288|nr:uncharacterized protein LOC128548450 [Mercenaria mercenaria]
MTSEEGSDYDTDSNSEESETDSNVDQNEKPQTKGKRGRPIGYRKRKEDDFVKRQKRDQRQLMPTMKIRVWMCCAQLCTTLLSGDIINSARERFQNLRIIQRGQYILDWIKAHTAYDKDTGKMTTAFLVGNINVCKKAFLVILGFPASTYYEIRRKYMGKEI